MVEGQHLGAMQQFWLAGQVEPYGRKAEPKGTGDVYRRAPGGPWLEFAMGPLET